MKILSVLFSRNNFFEYFPVKFYTFLYPQYKKIYNFFLLLVFLPLLQHFNPTEPVVEKSVIL